MDEIRTSGSRAWLLPLVALGLATAPNATAQTCVEPPDGLYAWWTGDDSGADVRRGFDGELVNGAGFGPGFVGEAFALDGVAGGQDDYVVLPRVAADGLADFSVEFWTNTTDSVGAFFSAANGASGANEVLVFQGTSGVDVWIAQSAARGLPVFLNDGAWHHVALVRDGAMGRFYVDGVQVDQRAYPVRPLDVGPIGLLLGQEQDCLGGCFQADQALDGLMDEVSVYARALTSAEVEQIAMAGIGGKCKPPAPVSPEPPEPDVSLERVAVLEEEVDLLWARILGLEVAIDALAAKTHVHPALDRGKKRGHWHRHHDDDGDDWKHRDKKRKKKKR